MVDVEEQLRELGEWKRKKQEEERHFQERQMKVY
jgi:hypothetical protein